MIAAASSMDGSVTVTGWKRRSSAASFSMYLRYSANVVAPITWISPRESAGFRMFAAFMLPSASPVPTRLCTSSMNRMMLPSCFTSSTRPLMRLSNWPRNCVPATSAVRSRSCTSFLRSFAGTSPAAMRSARPSATAVLPTPGSPIRHGLFFVRRERICTTRSISRSRPMILSSSPRRAFIVRSVQYAAMCLRFDLWKFSFLAPRFSVCPFAAPRSCIVPSPSAFMPNWPSSSDGNGTAPPGSKPPSSGFIRLDMLSVIASSCSSVMPIFSMISLTGLIPSSFAQTRQ